MDNFKIGDYVVLSQHFENYMGGVYGVVDSVDPSSKKRRRATFHIRLINGKLMTVFKDSMSKISKAEYDTAQVIDA